MKYSELLEKTHIKKLEAIREINVALKGPCGFLVKNEIQNKPGAVAFHWLADFFIQQLIEHMDEFMAEDNNVAEEVQRIYMAYENGDSDLYYQLPIEAQLFEKEC